MLTLMHQRVNFSFETYVSQTPQELGRQEHQGRGPFCI